DQELPRKVQASLDRWNVDPRFLKIEITESSILADVERQGRTLAELQELGVQLAIDDFGTGYSALGRLQRLPFDTLKIDRSFVAGVENAHDDAPIV
ncbi:EAL domain-containing protein, partial [Salmonella enterica subsp. enterica serovar Minnesota]|uniref:EAL domain-containing protein n=1 Tax=Salmonella enterica TaxID=28901 RepID=UPI003D26BAE5